MGIESTKWRITIRVADNAIFIGSIVVAYAAASGENGPEPG